MCHSYLMFALLLLPPTDSFSQHEQEIKELEASIKALQNDMQKLNALIAKNNKLQSVLVENNLGLETEFLSQLRQAEVEAIHLEQKIEAVRQEKENIMHDIIESE